MEWETKNGMQKMGCKKWDTKNGIQKMGAISWVGGLNGFVCERKKVGTKIEKFGEILCDCRVDWLEGALDDPKPNPQPPLITLCWVGGS